ncbi:MAG: hypothetical protein PUA73_02125 [Bacilli bacterium]|nr:hypothetical protein [Bacilli bacterium]
MKKLYIDFDGVIYNSIEVSYDMALKQGFKKNEEEFFLFYKNLNWCDVLKKSRQINDSFNCIKKIIDSGKYDVAILTHIVTLEEALEKIKLIRKNINDISIILVPKAVSKTEVVKACDAILIDDYVQNLKEWKAAGGIGVRFDLDMDGKGFPVISKLDKVLEILE